MDAHFADPKMQGFLLAELESWRGTKWRANQCRKKAGVDCVRFVHAVLAATGAIEPIRWPVYVTQGGGKPMGDLLTESMLSIPRLARIWTPSDGAFPTIISGDVFQLSTGRAIHHLSIVGRPPVLWHCWEHSGVCEANLHDSPVEKFAVAIYRSRAIAVSSPA